MLLYVTLASACPHAQEDVCHMFSTQHVRDHSRFQCTRTRSGFAILRGNLVWGHDCFLFEIQHEPWNNSGKCLKKTAIDIILHLLEFDWLIVVLSE